MTDTDQTLATLFEDQRPDYAIKSMEERKSLPSNGLVAVSTFSGCGGSSLGLKTAGYQIPYCVEFTDQAKAAYEANAPETFVDQRDVRDIQPEEILDRIGMKPGELDLFEGSPPCSSFSQAGSPRGGEFGETRGKVKDYSGGIKQATDDLFDEWVRLVAGIMPKTIIAENVPDMAKRGPAQQYFFGIQRQLKDLGYQVHARVYSSLWAGCATIRKRMVIMGVRSDVGLVPRPTLSGSGYTLSEALATMPAPPPQDEMDFVWTDGTGKHWETGEKLPGCSQPVGACEKHAQVNGRCAYAVAPMWATLKPGEWHEQRITLGRAAWDKPLVTATATGANPGAATIMHPDECRRFTATELAWLSGFPADFVLTGSPADRYERIARAVTPPLYEALGPYLARVITGDGGAPCAA